MKLNENEKIKKYLDLAREQEKLLNIKAPLKRLEKRLVEQGTRGRNRDLLDETMLQSARILWRHDVELIKPITHTHTHTYIYIYKLKENLCGNCLDFDLLFAKEKLEMFLLLIYFCFSFIYLFLFLFFVSIHDNFFSWRFLRFFLHSYLPGCSLINFTTHGNPLRYVSSVNIFARL